MKLTTKIVLALFSTALMCATIARLTTYYALTYLTGFYESIPNTAQSFVEYGIIPAMLMSLTTVIVLSIIPTLSYFGLSKLFTLKLPKYSLQINKVVAVSCIVSLLSFVTFFGADATNNLILIAGAN